LYIYQVPGSVTLDLYLEIILPSLFPINCIIKVKQASNNNIFTKTVTSVHGSEKKNQGNVIQYTPFYKDASSVSE